VDLVMLLRLVALLTAFVDPVWIIVELVAKPLMVLVPVTTLVVLSMVLLALPLLLAALSMVIALLLKMLVVLVAKVPMVLVTAPTLQVVLLLNSRLLWLSSPYHS